MGGVAEGVKERDDLFVEALVHRDHIGGGDAEILGKSAVPVHAHALGTFAPLDLAGAAVAAGAAADVAFAGDQLADLQAGDALTQFGDLAHILVADGHAGLHMGSGPVGPVVNMYVGTADGGLVDLDQHLAGADFGHGLLPQLQTHIGGGLDDNIHHFHASVLQSKTIFRFCQGFVFILRTVYPDSSGLSIKNLPPGSFS